MNIKAAKQFSEIGALQKAGISGPTLGFKKYTIVLEVNGRFEMLETARGQARQFTTIDSAANVLKDLGFSEWKYRS